MISNKRALSGLPPDSFFGVLASRVEEKSGIKHAKKNHAVP